MSSAQLDMLQEPAREVSAEGHALRQQAAERLAAHRLRRSRIAHSAAHGAGVGIEPGGAAGEGDEQIGRRPAGRRKVADAVAERYAQSPSYRAFLAAEAQRAIEHAEAAADVAARNAEAVVAVQQELLDELEMWTAPQAFRSENAETLAWSGAASPSSDLKKNELSPVRELSAGGVTVRLYEDLGRRTVPSRRVGRADVAAEHDVEAQALEDEIEFRKAPVFDDFRGLGMPVEPIAANLIEFPRQLVAPRKVRPRLAEGPLLEEPLLGGMRPVELESRSPQLRIFEVEAQQPPTELAPVSAAPEWSSIWLEAHSMPELYVASAEQLEQTLPSLLPPKTAPLSARLMATAVDGLLVSLAFTLFAAVAAYSARAVPTGSLAAIAALPVLGVLYLGYQLLFFSFSGGTPGMRYARIGLCTFTDENPSRAAMRRRVLSTVIAACPLGLGLLWVLLDDDRLGWHDRMSRMYQRAY